MQTFACGRIRKQICRIAAGIVVRFVVGAVAADGRALWPSEVGGVSEPSGDGRALWPSEGHYGRRSRHGRVGRGSWLSDGRYGRRRGTMAVGVALWPAFAYQVMAWKGGAEAAVVLLM